MRAFKNHVPKCINILKHSVNTSFMLPDLYSMFGIASRDLKPLASLCSVHVHYITGGTLVLYFIAILFLTPYSIIIIIINIIIIFIITHQQKVTEFEEWICKLFFFLWPQYEGSVNEVLFFVTNVKTQVL